jgi:hypothetical protein
MKATIKSIPVTKVTESVQVKTPVNTIGKVERLYHAIDIPENQKQGLVNGIWYDLNKLKTIVAEYKKVNYGYSLAKVIHIQLPLKHLDWQQVIDDGSLDSGKEVEIEYEAIVCEECPHKYHPCPEGCSKLIAQLILQQETKQETLEEAQLKIPTKFCIPHKHYISDDDKICYETGYKDGAKWQQERMYSEEEVVEKCMNFIAQYAQGNTNIWNRELIRESLKERNNGK